REQLCREHGGTLHVEGPEMLTFPPPEQLLALERVDGLSREKLRRLHAIAAAAGEGRLERERLLAVDQEEAISALLELPGIGPFWSQLILVRSVGPTDALALGEPRLRAATAARYDAPEVVSDDAAFRALAERWRPFRTW